MKIGIKNLTATRSLRNGSMLLLCMLAATTLSLAGLAILQCHSRNLATTKSIESSVRARMTKDALMQRAIAVLRADPTTKDEFADKELDLPDAYCQIVPVSKTQSQVSIYLYENAKVPALLRIIDTEKLTASK